MRGGPAAGSPRPHPLPSPQYEVVNNNAAPAVAFLSAQLAGGVVALSAQQDPIISLGSIPAGGTAYGYFYT